MSTRGDDDRSTARRAVPVRRGCRAHDHPGRGGTARRPGGGRAGDGQPDHHHGQPDHPHQLRRPVPQPRLHGHDPQGQAEPVHRLPREVRRQTGPGAGYRAALPGQAGDHDRRAEPAAPGPGGGAVVGRPRRGRGARDRGPTLRPAGRGLRQLGRRLQGHGRPAVGPRRGRGRRQGRRRVRGREGWVHVGDARGRVLGQPLAGPGGRECPREEPPPAAAGGLSLGERDDSRHPGPRRRHAVSGQTAFRSTPGPSRGTRGSRARGRPSPPACPPRRSTRP